MFANQIAFLRQFQKREDGVVAIVFALALIGILLIVGLAIDVGRAVHATTRLETALDAAALAGAKGLRLQNLSEGETRELAERLFRENVAEQDRTPLSITSVNVRVDVRKSEVQIDADSELPMQFGQLAGIRKMTFKRSATAIFEAKDIEIAVMLDVTGSMSPPNKIGALKDATKTLVDIVIPEEETGQKVRVGFAPYSSGVNAGIFAANVTGGRSVAAGNTCAFERQDLNQQTSDAQPTGQLSLRSSNDIEPGLGPNPCPPANATILPLTDDKDLLKSTVDGYGTRGYTAGHLGIAWASYLLSPQWGTVVGNDAEAAGYDDKSVQKFAIVMTDGEFNTYNGERRFPSHPDSIQASKDTCAAMKARGIVVYTVGFQLNAAGAEDVMATCASDSSKAFTADDGAELEAAFRAIAEDIVTLRLTQ